MLSSDEADDADKFVQEFILQKVLRPHGMSQSRERSLCEHGLKEALVLREQSVTSAN